MKKQPYVKEPSDLLAQETLSARLAETPGCENVHAWVVAGVATLTGHVRSQFDVVRIGDIAASSPGVNETINLLEFEPS